MTPKAQILKTPKPHCWLGSIPSAHRFGFLLPPSITTPILLVCSCLSGFFLIFWLAAVYSSLRKSTEVATLGNHSCGCGVLEPVLGAFTSLHRHYPGEGSRSSFFFCLFCFLLFSSHFLSSGGNESTAFLALVAFPLVSRPWSALRSPAGFQAAPQGRKHCRGEAGLEVTHQIFTTA